jgi:hypothetical protein
VAAVRRVWLARSRGERNARSLDVNAAVPTPTPFIAPAEPGGEVREWRDEVGSECRGFDPVRASAGSTVRTAATISSGIPIVSTSRQGVNDVSRQVCTMS